MFDNTRRALRWALRKVKRTVSSPKMPDHFWLDKAYNYTPYTSDAASLERKNKVLLFDYGSFMRGHADHFSVEREAEFRATAFTRGHYHCFRYTEDGKSVDAVVLKEQDRPQFERIREPLMSSKPLQVKGELFLAPSELLYTLDNVRENGYVYRRERVKVIVPYSINHGSYKLSEKEHVHVWAWWYVGMPKWYEALGSDPEYFRQVGKYEPRDPSLGPYYSFTMREYDN